MTKRWPKITSLILLVLLILTATTYVYQGIEVKTLRQLNEQTLQTLQNQTQLVVELRKTLARESFRNFGSERELRSWVSKWVSTKLPIVIEFFNTSIELRGQKYSLYQDCDDYAEAMQRDALKDYYLMSVVLVDGNGQVYGTKVTDLANHAGAIAITDNAYWFIEPQTGTVVKITGRD